MSDTTPPKGALDAPPVWASPEHSGGFDDAWAEVLAAVDTTYAKLVDYQSALEQQAQIQDGLRAFIAEVMASVSDVLIVISRDGVIEEASASVAQLTGRDIDSLRATSALDLFGDPDAMSKALSGVLMMREHRLIEMDLLGPQEATLLELVISPRMDERNRCSGYICTGRPIGELRAAYQKLEQSHSILQQTQAQLVRNEKMASLGRLLAGVAHELNNPISFVYANAHALERYAGKFEQYFERVAAGASRTELIQLREDLKLDREVRNLRSAVDGARDGAERVRDIVSDLRRLSSDGSGEQMEFDLVEIARIGVDWFLRGTKRDLKITYRGLDSLVIKGHRGHLQQVVMNLVQNAADAIGDQTDGQIEITFGTKDGMAVMQVWDNGPGIPEEVAQQAFDPFFTTKPVGQGTGLGLSISHKIAEEHGGYLRIYDTGAGACLRLSLPLEMPE